MKTNSPISLNIATTSLGIFLGNLIPLVQIWENESHSWANIICFGIGLASFVVAIITGIFALTAKNDAKKLLNEIRTRQPIQSRP